MEGLNVVCPIINEILDDELETSAYRLPSLFRSIPREAMAVFIDVRKFSRLQRLERPYASFDQRYISHIFDDLMIGEYEQWRSRICCAETVDKQ